MGEKDTGRVEAFSDGVFAIAITLLILEIRMPRVEGDGGNRALIAGIIALWPSAVALVLSFFVILVMWINHHELLRLVRKVDYSFLFANGFLLLVVTIVPFPTALLAQYLGTRAANAASAAYCATFLVGGIAFNLLFASIAHRRRLVKADVEDGVLERIRKAYHAGFVVYAAAVGAALWNAAAGLVMCAALLLVWVRLCYHSESERRPAGTRRER